MAAGQGFKTFTTGEVLTAGDVNGYLMQGINVFADATARDAAITAPAEGQFAFTKDNNSLWYYDGAAWVASGAAGDIEGVTAGVGISGGGTSGTVTITNSMATAITTAGDLIQGTGSGTFDRLGIGSTGQVLTVSGGAPAWVTPSGAATNWTSLGSSALSGSQTVTISGISGINQILVIMRGASSATAQSEFRVRINGDTGNNYNNYGIQNAAPSSYTAGQFGMENQAGTSKVRLAQMSTAGASTASGYLLISGANAAGVKQYNGAAGVDMSSGNSGAQYIVGGFWNNTSTVTSVSLNSEFGNFDAGTIYVYGAA